MNIWFLALTQQRNFSKNWFLTNIDKTDRALEFLHQGLQLGAELAADADEVEFSGGDLDPFKHGLQHLVGAVLYQELQRRVESIVILLYEQSLLGEIKNLNVTVSSNFSCTSSS